MWTYRYLAAAVAERAALVPREKAALINAEAKLAASARGCLIRIAALYRVLIGYVSFVLVAAAVHGVRCTARSAESSSLPRSGRRLRPTRGALSPRAAGLRPG
jgi:hypothetical protein